MIPGQCSISGRNAVKVHSWAQIVLQVVRTYTKRHLDTPTYLTCQAEIACSLSARNTRLDSYTVTRFDICDPFAHIDDYTTRFVSKSSLVSNLPWSKPSYWMSSDELPYSHQFRNGDIPCFQKWTSFRKRTTIRPEHIL